MLKLISLALLLLAAGAHSRSLEQRLPLSTPDLDTISIYIKKLLENFKKEMPRGIPELNIPPLEPLVIPIVDVPRIREGIADVKLDMSALRFQGLSNFDVEHARGDLENLGIDIGMRFRQLRGQGRYNLDGKILFFPLYGNGNAYVQVTDLRVRVRASVRIVNMQNVQLDNLHADVSFGDVQMLLEGILGGGNLGDVVNQLLNALGKLVFDQTKHLFMPELIRIIHTAVNSELRKVNLQDIIGGILPSEKQLQLLPFDAAANHYVDRVLNQLLPFDAAANHYVDRVLNQLRPELQRVADPLGIPDQVARFSKRIGIITVRGSARLTHGQVRGLSSLHRAGNCNIGSRGSGASIRVVVGCLLGVNNLSGGFRARAEFMGVGVSASVSIGVPRVRVQFTVNGGIQEGSRPELEQFNISEVSGINVRISGLGPLDWIFNSVANVVINAVRSQIVSAIEGPIRNELRNALRQVEMPRLG